mmetsp:Transcript_58048/g.149431  ORF Transcript_58048/g.149431 Transcript_58048/m.149431 type:complete len:285 (-) Transcript_58048:893-1747(-)
MPLATRSIAACRSCCSMLSLFRRTARMAASFMTFWSSAPLKPAATRAMPSRSASPATFLSAACTSSILLRPSTDGRVREITRSKRPGLRSAASRVSAALVAATTITPLSPVPKPSISVRIWLRVWSRSPLPVPAELALRVLPTTSISSMKMMQGELSRALAKISRTREAPTPTNRSTNSEADAWIRATPASPARARARSVLPVPGGPVSRTPFGTFAPTALNALGSLRNCTISSTSCLASSMPATWLKSVPVTASAITSLEILKPRRPSRKSRSQMHVPTSANG